MKITLIYLSLFLLLLFLNGVQHEEVHKAIFQSFGIDSKIDYFAWDVMGMKTTGTKPCPNEACEAMHMENEIVSYNLTALFMIIGIGIGAIIFILEARLWTYS